MTTPTIEEIARKCQHCGLIHETTCPRIKAIEYADDGVTLRRIEFHPPPQTIPFDPSRMLVGGKDLP